MTTRSCLCNKREVGRIDVATRLIVAPSKAEEAGAEKLVAGTCQTLFVERTTPRCPDLARLRSAPYYALPVLSEPCARVRLTSQPLNSERGDDPWKEDDLPCQDSQNKRHRQSSENSASLDSAWPPLDHDCFSCSLATPYLTRSCLYVFQPTDTSKSAAFAEWPTLSECCSLRDHACEEW